MTIKKGASVKHDRFRGIALRVSAVYKNGNSEVVMVGDDQRHLVPTDELTALDRDDYCGSCGQIGCSWG